MAILLKIVGGLWAFLGATNILSMLTRSSGANLGTVLGLVFNMVLFVLPGLGIYGIGVAITKRQAATGNQPGPIKPTNWVSQHPVATVLLVLVGIYILGALSSSSSKNASTVSPAAQNSPTLKQISTVPSDYLGRSFEMTVNAKADKYYNFGFDDDTRYYSLKIWDDSIDEFEGIYAYLGKSKQNRALFEKLIAGQETLRIHGSIPAEKYEKGSNAYFQVDKAELVQ